MSDAPLVSVIVPAYRAAPTISRAVRSLLAQTLADWQAIVISDDGVDYCAVLAAAGIKDARLCFVSSGGVGTGPAFARNVGLRHATGQIVAPLDADDTWAPSRLALMVPLVLKAGAAFDNVRVVDDMTGRVLSVLFDQEREFELDAAAFLDTDVPLMPVARRGLIDGWDTEIELCDDVALNLKLFDRLTAIPTVAQALHDYRVRPGSICHSDRSADLAERSYGVLLKRLARDKYGLSDPVLLKLSIEKITAKRALNRAFAQARADGYLETFQQFVAARRRTSLATGR